jgi:Ala-tRNA(Pro) deacylase
MALLEGGGARFRVIDHPPEGRTELVSQLRGHHPRHAAKCMVLMVKLGKKTTRYVLGVVPGDARVDFGAVKACCSGTYAAFAAPQVAERLGGSVVGTILPFSFDADLELIVDPSLLESDEIYFNAARLDRSIALRTADYLTIARPRVAGIGERSQPAGEGHPR